MMDKFSKEKRHEIMMKIKGKDTQIEIKVRKWLFHNNIRYRKNYKLLPGSPDIVITKLKIAIFVNGCFWHGHENCKLYTTPKTNTEFWKNKIQKNKERDARIIEELNNLGWLSIVIWECQLGKKFDETMATLLKEIWELDESK